MAKRKEHKIQRTRDEAIAEVRKFLKNAKEILSKVKIEYGRYTDTKYVREASAMAYLAALRAIDAYLLGKGVEPEKLPSSIK